MKKSNRVTFKKVVTEQFPVNPTRGGGIVKIEAWENEEGEIVKYNMAYINPLIFSGDNGRVIGYDNTHHFHHRHYFGEMSEINDFSSYQELLYRFEKELKEFIK
jgi:Family of unknown function (DUF6516)